MERGACRDAKGGPWPGRGGCGHRGCVHTVNERNDVRVREGAEDGELVEGEGAVARRVDCATRAGRTRARTRSDDRGEASGGEERQRASTHSLRSSWRAGDRRRGGARGRRCPSRRGRARAPWRTPPCAHTPPLHTHGLAFRRPCQPWPIAALAVQHGKRKTRHPGNGQAGRGKGRARAHQSSAAHSALCARRTPSLRPCLARSTLGRWLACVRASERQSVRVRRPSECVRGRSPPRRPRPFARRPQPIR